MYDKKLQTPLQFLKGVGEKRATLFAEELNIASYEDLLHYYPFRYLDRSRFYTINEITAAPTLVQIKGRFISSQIIGTGNKRRLSAIYKDATGQIECVWFKGIDYFYKQIKQGVDYVLFGKPTVFGKRLNFTHPEIETLSEYLKKNTAPFTPIYPLTEKVKKFRVTANTIQNLTRELLILLKDQIDDHFLENFRKEYNLMPLYDALYHVHFPENMNILNKARFRLKFDELFFIQLSILKAKQNREAEVKGIIFNTVGSKLHTFYNNYLPFELTNAQKRVIKEMRENMKSGRQMNRLLQGDVGSGKTLVALMLAFITSDNNYQCALMAPTEILAQQHFKSLKEMVGDMPFEIDLLTGSIKTKARRGIHERLKTGQTNLIIGTHALIEKDVEFHKLGLVIIDEQHRFGVAQRARLWKKSIQPPHVMVMTATPIPRTLALTVHGDLDSSVIDELPPGRKPIHTRHVYENKRKQVYEFMQQQIAAGRQIYVVFPLIQESEKLDFQNLEEGYERIIKAFPPPNYKTVMVHGQMKSDEKEEKMLAFARNEAQIMVATTVIEVGVNVPNASVMVIESAQRFGLSQLHQLRGRVGRGASQSYCILMSPYEISKNTRQRLDIMTQTNDGFIIAEEDMKLRGPGNIDGTQQSGDPYDFKIASLTQDQAILMLARRAANAILNEDSELTDAKYEKIKQQLKKRHPKEIDWRQVS
ncbi:MAG: ATP-dependent DNA helicase RecG [Salinivirgaceae bacterium]|jgi:ATP-dependent DNA helicase RecG|nr:ATP-dependent DNA helicase RecG [Salinivirgaceae bacterium]